MNHIQLSGVASVIVTGLSLVLVARILGASRAAAAALRGLLRTTGLILIAVGLLGACLVAMGLFGFLAWPIVMGVWWRAAIHRRTMQKRSLLAALSLAADRQMPIGPMALAFANEQEGGFAVRARELAATLDAGATLGDAIAISRGTLPPESALAARLGAESGDLAGALQATSYSQVFDRTLLRPVMLRLLYLFPITLGFYAWMKLQVEPSYIKIFDDFGAALPPITRVVISGNAPEIVATPGYLFGWIPTIWYTWTPPAWSIAGPRANLFWLCLWCMLAFILLFVLAWLQWRGARHIRLPVLTRIINWVDMGPILRVLGLAAGSSRPFSRVLNALARFHPKRSVRARIRAVVRDVDNGEDWQRSFVRHRLLGATDAAVLSAAQRNGNLAWALAEMAESFERRANYRLQALAQVVLPLSLLPVAILTAVLVIGYFAPLVSLIENLS